MTGTSPTNPHPERQRRVRGALTFFSISAYATGIMLLVLCAEMVLKYIVYPGTDPVWLDRGGLYVAQIHGLLYFIFLIATVNLGTKARWAPLKWVITALGGVVPLLSFFVEKQRRAEVTEAFQLQ